MYATSSPEPLKVNNRFAHLVTGTLNDPEKQSLIALALAILQEQHQPGQTLDSPSVTREYLRLRLADYPAEVFGCLFLDNQHRILAVRELFTGTVDGAAVHPRVVVQQALGINAAALVFYHNHPSGVAEPSQADQAITRRLKEALALVDIRVLDHFVVTCETSVSFAERDLL